ncbi:MAG: exopolyphosphatase [Anaeromicrobium sp.]|uniref:exopolyphosphatase n=1 Tax=Anaeromicrobium sp. TaxID=1929132 RepID=UPI0025EF0CAC|nr:exopolyphosphatase [Anaeromicrobium sp.]MCT4593452.1 exopolyphosphatase [Anaeromicrobium sp.]
MKKIAIIDLGSNSARMIIMKISNKNSYKMIEQEKDMVRLSENMGKEKTLKEPAMNRTIHVLKLFKRLIEAHKAHVVHAYATAALRNAKNQEEFLFRVKKEVGLDLKVISGKEEAYYDFLGVINTIDSRDFVMIDIGGGSTEIGLIRDRKLVESVSLPYGSVVLTESFLGEHRVCHEKLKALEGFMKKEMKKLKWLEQGKKLPIIGLGGSIRTVAKIDRKHIGFPLERLHNYQLTYEEFQSAYEKAIQEKLSDRKKVPGINKERADIIAGGLAPLKVLMDMLDSKKLIVSGNGLREGVFYENYLKDFDIHNNLVSDVLRHSVENGLKNYDVNMEHSIQVKKIGLLLFDELLDLHKLGTKERPILEVAALLHDIGIYVDYYNHHKHGFYLVLNSRINGLTNRELLMCAFLVGMHRNFKFKKDWKEYDMLISEDDYNTIRKLALLLKMSEMLDRNEYGSVKDIKANISKEHAKIILTSNNSLELEIEAAMKSEDDFYKLFKRKLIMELRHIQKIN